VVVSGFRHVALLGNFGPLVAFEAEGVDVFVVLVALLSADEQHGVLDAHALMVRDPAWARPLRLDGLPLDGVRGVGLQRGDALQVDLPEAVERALLEVPAPVDEEVVVRRVLDEGRVVRPPLGELAMHTDL